MIHKAIADKALREAALDEITDASGEVQDLSGKPLYAFSRQTIWEPFYTTMCARKAYSVSVNGGILTSIKRNFPAERLPS